MDNDMVLAPDAIPSVQPPVAVTPGALLQSAVAAGLGVDGIRALAEIYERDQARQAVQAFNAALSAVQAECGTIAKSKRADRYMYAPLDEIAKRVRPLLDRHGFSYSFDSDLTEHGVAVTFVLRHRDGHSERTRFTAPVDAAMKVNSTQKVGSALTYGKRYAMLAGLGLSTGDADDDAAGTAETITAEQAADLRAVLDEGTRTEPGLCAIYGIGSLDDLPASLYKPAMALAEKARGK